MRPASTQVVVVVVVVVGALANEHKHTEMGTFPLKYGFALLDKVSRWWW